MKICIDAGHNYSNYDTGAECNGLREQDITFKIADTLKNFFHSVGITTVTTRPTLETNLGHDINSSLNKRIKIANDASCDYFISIHCNSNENPSANGTEVLISNSGGNAERLANAIQNNMINCLSLNDRGIKIDTQYLKCKLAVLHNTNMPAILIETAFISNEKDAIILKYKYADIARAIFLGVCEHLKINTQLKDNKGEDMSKFSDVTGHWAEKHIEKLVDYGIVNGYDDKTFRPDNSITRAEVAVMIANALSVMGK